MKLTLAIVVMLALLAAYVAGYFAHSNRGDYRTHDFRHLWLCTLYDPAARVEAWLSGETIILKFREGEGSVWFFYDGQP